MNTDDYRALIQGRRLAEKTARKANALVTRRMTLYFNEKNPKRKLQREKLLNEANAAALDANLAVREANNAVLTYLKANNTSQGC